MRQVSKIPAASVSYTTLANLHCSDTFSFDEFRSVVQFLLWYITGALGLGAAAGWRPRFIVLPESNAVTPCGRRRYH